MVVRVDDALQALEAHDALKAQLIEMRFFGGMTAEESANVLGLPLPKVRSELQDRPGLAEARARQPGRRRKNNFQNLPPVSAVPCTGVPAQ